MEGSNPIEASIGSEVLGGPSQDLVTWLITMVIVVVP